MEAGREVVEMRSQGTLKAGPYKCFVQSGVYSLANVEKWKGFMLAPLERHKVS